MLFRLIKHFSNQKLTSCFDGIQLLIFFIPAIVFLSNRQLMRLLQGSFFCYSFIWNFNKTCVCFKMCTFGMTDKLAIFTFSLPISFDDSKIPLRFWIYFNNAKKYAFLLIFFGIVEISSEKCLSIGSLS